MNKKIFIFLFWCLLIINVFNTSVMAYQYFILNGGFIMRPSIILAIPFMYFDFLKPYEENVFLFFYGKKENIDYAFWPTPILRRSLTSFLVLTFLSYSFLILTLKFYKIKNIYLKLLGIISTLIISCWFQFLSVQYVGRGEKFFEYYSIWVFREKEYNYKGDCYDSEFLRIRKSNFKDIDYRIEFLDQEFFNCHELKDSNNFLNSFTKEYELKPGVKMRILNGIGPFFNLNVVLSTY